LQPLQINDFWLEQTVHNRRKQAQASFMPAIDVDQRADGVELRKKLNLGYVCE
jgi:hypothetical protein